MDMGDGSSFIDEITNSDLFGHDADGASGFEWADEFISSVEGEDRSNRSSSETSVVNSHQTVQYGQASSGNQLTSQTGTVNVQVVQTNTSIQQTNVQQNVQQIQQQPAPIIQNLTNLTQGGGQLIQGVNGQLFLKPLPNGQFQLATQPPIQHIQHPQQSSSPIPIQPHPHGSPHVNIVQNPSQSPIPISSPHVRSSSASPHVSGSHTPLQQSRQFQNVNFLQVGSQTQPQLIRSLPINSQISNNFQAQQVLQSQGHILSHQGQMLQSQGHSQVHNQGQNFVNTQNTVIQNPNVVNVNVAHVLCSSQFQGQQGQSIQGTLIQTADGKHIIIPSTQLPSSNQIQIQNVPQMTIQPQFVPTSSSTGTTPLVQGGQVLEGNAAALGGLGYIRIATPSSTSNQDSKVQQPQNMTHFMGLNAQGQQILIQRTPTQGQNTGIVLRQVAPQNILQLPQTQQSASTGQILPQTSQSTQQIVLPQVQRIVAGPQGQQQIKLVTPNNLQTGNMPMTINIGGQNVILPSNIQQLIQQQQQQPQISQVQKPTSSNENVLLSRPSSSGMSTPSSGSFVISGNSATPQQLNIQISQASATGQGQSINSQVPTFLLPAVSSSTANMTPVTTTVSQTKQVVSQVSISNSPKMYQTISSVSSNVSSTNVSQKPFLSAVTNAPKLPVTTIQLTPQAQQQITNLQLEIRKLQSLKDPTDHQKQQLVHFRELQKKIIVKGQVKQQQIIQPQVVQNISSAPSVFIGQPAVSSSVVLQPSVQSQASTTSLTSQGQAGGVIQSQSSIVQGQTLVSSDNSSTCSTKSVQSQNGSIMSVSPTGNKSTQPIIIGQLQPQATTGSVIIQGQQGPIVVQSQPGSVVVQGHPGTVLVQGQPGAVRMQVQSNTSSTSTVSSTNLVNTTVTPVKTVPPGGAQGSTPVAATQQIAVPTQIKIANHILTLNLTPEQKEKVQGYLAKMPPEQQQQQMALFLKLQHQQKMNAQVQAQIQQQKKLQAQTSIQSQLPLTVQPIVTSAAGSNMISVEQPSTSPSKPNIIHRVSVAAIPKHQLIHQQMGKDQANAIQTDTKTPFRNPRDMYRRLLRYHVFQTIDPPDHLIKKDDEMFDDLSEGLVKKKNWMFEKYRGLLLEESMREEQTAEMMMIQKMMNEDLKETIEGEKATIKRNPELFEPMPRKYLKLEPQSEDDLDVKFDPNCIQIKQEKDLDPSPVVPSVVKKEKYDSDGSRPSTPKFKLVIKSDGRGYSSKITEEDMNQNGLDSDEMKDDENSDFMSGINVKQEQIEIDDNVNDVPFNESLKPFNSYSHDNVSSYNHSRLNVSNDLDDNGADSNSDVTVVSDDENKSDAIVIDDDDDDDVDSKGDNRDKSVSQKPVKIEHEDISSDFTDFFSKQYQSGSSEMPYYSKTSHSDDISDDHGFPTSDQISNDIYSQNSDAQSTQNSDAHSTQTIPYSEDGNSVKDEDISNDVDYNKSTSSFAHYEPISSPEADHEENSFNYLNSYNSFNMSGIRDQGLNVNDRESNDHVTGSPPWQEETVDEDDAESADRIKAEMESAINSILSLN